jgi:hypothetical protein
LPHQAEVDFAEMAKRYGVEKLTLSVEVLVSDARRRGQALL